MSPCPGSTNGMGPMRRDGTRKTPDNSAPAEASRSPVQATQCEARRFAVNSGIKSNKQSHSRIESLVLGPGPCGDAAVQNGKMREMVRWFPPMRG